MPGSADMTFQSDQTAAYISMILQVKDQTAERVSGENGTVFPFLPYAGDVGVSTGAGNATVP